MEGKNETNAIVEVEEINPITETDWTKRIELVKEITAKNCSKTEFELLCYTALQYGLNPLKKEIWAVKYQGSPANIMVGRDGYLSIASRSKEFDGMDTTYNPSPVKEGSPRLIGVDTESSATCTVYRKGVGHPITVTVYMKEYYNGISPVWKQKPITMLCKVSESQALRKAFNISGVYSEEELSLARLSQEEKKND